MEWSQQKLNEVMIFLRQQRIVIIMLIMYQVSFSELFFSLSSPELSRMRILIEFMIKYDGMSYIIPIVSEHETDKKYCF